MYCITCGNLIKVRRKLNNLFAQPIHNICLNCIFSHLQLVDEILVVPLCGGHVMYIIDLLTETIYKEELYFSYLSSYLYIFNKVLPDITILYFDEFNEPLYNLIEDCRLGNILILTLKLKGEIVL